MRETREGLQQKPLSYGFRQITLPTPDSCYKLQCPRGRFLTPIHYDVPAKHVQNS